MICAVHNNPKNRVQNWGIKLLENFLLVLGPDIRKMECRRNGKGLAGKGQNGKMGKLGEMTSGTKWKMGKNEIGRNGKRAGQILGRMGKGRNRKGRKKNGRNGKILGETGLGKLGINHESTICFCKALSRNYSWKTGENQLYVVIVFAYWNRNK